MVVFGQSLRPTKKGSSSLRKEQKNNDYKKQILIVEDDLFLSQQLEIEIKRMGYDVIGKISNAADAVDIIKEQNPDLVLIDILLAGEMDGVDAISIIRDFSDVPVLYLTGNTDEKTRKRAHASRPVAYIAKPVDLLLLKKTINEILNY